MTAALTLTLFPDLSGGVAQASTTTWPELVADCRNPKTYAKKSDLPLIKLAVFGTVRSKDNSLRTNANVIAISGLEGDYDAEEVQPAEAAALLEAAGIAAVIYTSPSHTPQKPRWRVLCASSHEHPPEERRELVGRLNSVLGGILAKESFVLSQSYYFGAVEGVVYEVHEVAGQPIDLIANLTPVYSSPKKVKEATQAPASQSAGSLDALVTPTAGDVLQEILAGDDVHGNSLRVIGRWVQGGADDVTIKAIFGVLANQVADQRGIERARDLMGGELDRMISGARDKGYAPAPATFPAPLPITTNEWETARSTPRCIVENYLHADVGVFIGAGGISKTTVKLSDSIHIVLGLPLYGLTIRTPGPVMIITAEDSREMLVARLRSIAQAMNLSDADVAVVMERVLIVDVSGNGFKLTEVRGDVVRPSEGVDRIIEAARTIKPVLVVIDPAVSFGVGESRVNDAEQGLIEAARRLRSALGCCIQFVHHTGKQNAREGTTDQYSGRGGSAFADGARMVHVLQTVTAADWRKETGTELEAGQSGLRLARPKMSYCPPCGDILIRRTGYRFEHIERTTTDSRTKLEDSADQLWQLLTVELSQGHYHSKNTLESLATGLKRSELRAALDWLFASQRIDTREVPNTGKGGKRTYLHPIGSPSQNGEAIEKSAENADCFASQKSVFASPPPIGNKTAANLPPPLLPSLSYGSPDIHGEPMANPANQSEEENCELI